jgi:hypothetical protein
MITCPDCAYKNMEGALFCDDCGYPLLLRIGATAGSTQAIDEASLEVTESKRRANTQKIRLDEIAQTQIQNAPAPGTTFLKEGTQIGRASCRERV